MLKLNLNAKPFEPKKKLPNENEVQSLCDLNSKIFHNQAFYLNAESLRRIEQSEKNVVGENYLPEHYFFKDVDEKLDYVKIKGNDDQDCSICLEKVKESNKRFGLLCILS